MNLCVIISSLWILTVVNAEVTRNRRHYPNLQYTLQQHNNENQHGTNSEYQQYYNYAERSSGIFEKLFPNPLAASIPAAPYGSAIHQTPNANVAGFTSSSGGTYQSFHSGGSSAQYPYGYQANSYPVIYQGSSGGNQQYKPDFGNNFQFESGTQFESKQPLPVGNYPTGSLSSSSSTSVDGSVIPLSISAPSTSVDQGKNPVPSAAASASAAATSNSAVNLDSKNNVAAGASSSATAGVSSSASAGASSSASAGASSTASAGASSNAKAEVSSSASSFRIGASGNAEADAENGIFLLAIPSDLTSTDPSVKGNPDFKILHIAVPGDILKQLVVESGTENASKLTSSLKTMVAAAVADAKSSPSSESAFKNRGSLENVKSTQATPVEEVKISPDAGVGVIPLSAEAGASVTPDDKNLFFVPIDGSSGIISQFLPEFFYTNQQLGNGQVVISTPKTDANKSSGSSVEQLVNRVFNKPTVTIGNRSGEENNFAGTTSVGNEQKVSIVVSGGNKVYPRIVFKYPNSKLGASSVYKIQPTDDKQNAYGYQVVSKNEYSDQRVYGNVGGGASNRQYPRYP